MGGRILRPEDILKGRKKALKELARDLTPDQLEKVENLLRRWEDKNRSELDRILGRERSRRLLKRLGQFE